MKNFTQQADKLTEDSMRAVCPWNVRIIQKYLSCAETQFTQGEPKVFPMFNVLESTS